MSFSFSIPDNDIDDMNALDREIEDFKKYFYLFISSSNPLLSLLPRCYIDTFSFDSPDTL